jgi:hypothetical protein
MSQFESTQLTIAKMSAVPNAMLSQRDVYVGWNRYGEDPRPVCTCIVFPEMRWVDWIETREDVRRRGYATEMLAAIEKERGEELIAEPATELGELLCESLRQRNDL